MKLRFNAENMVWIIRILLILFVVKLFWFAVELVWFSAEGIDHAESHNAKPLYYKIKLTPNKMPAPKKEIVKKPVGSIKDISLLAIYNASDITVVTIKYKGKTKVLGRGDEVNGFILDGAGSDFATFRKNGKTYQVDLIKTKRRGVGTIQRVPLASDHHTADSSEKGKDIEGEVTDAGDHKIVDRELFDHYIKNMDDIYRNIGIREIKEGNQIKGFQITFVRRGSPFAKLGVKRGDIIKSVNGQELTSYNAAFSVYKNMGDVQNVTLVIQRGNKEMELEYEVN